MPIQRYSVYELVGLTTKRRNSVLDMLLSLLLAAAARGDSQRKNSARHVWKVEQKCSTVWSSAYDTESKTAFLAAKNLCISATVLHEKHVNSDAGNAIMKQT